MPVPTAPVRIEMYSDLHCPSAYLTSYRMRPLRDEYRGRVVVERKSLALEYVHKQPTPRACRQTRNEAGDVRRRGAGLPSAGSSLPGEGRRGRAGADRTTPRQ